MSRGAAALAVIIGCAFAFGWISAVLAERWRRYRQFLAVERAMRGGQKPKQPMPVPRPSDAVLTCGRPNELWPSRWCSDCVTYATSDCVNHKHVIV